MLEYDQTTEQVAEALKVSPVTVQAWARKGYPIRRAGETQHVKLQGCMQVGLKLYRFNLRAVINFIENVNDQKWASLEENIQQRAALKRPKTGRASSLLTESDTAKQLKSLLALQKSRQRMHVTS